MVIESALVKPVVDALMALLQRGEKATLKRNAEAALREAIRELLLANPDENKAQARIAIAKAAGIRPRTWCWPRTCCRSTAPPGPRLRARAAPGASARRRRPGSTTSRPGHRPRARPRRNRTDRQHM